MVARCPTLCGCPVPNPLWLPGAEKCSKNERQVGMKKIFFPAAAILLIIIPLFFIIFSNNGLRDLVRLEKKRSLLVKKNDGLAEQNLLLYREIDRLGNDTGYIKSLVRQELRLIGEGEFIFKSGQERGKE